MTRFEELANKVDAFFARVAVRHGTDMQCETGCSDCCHVRLTVTAVEAAAIRAHVTTWSREQRRELARALVAEALAADADAAEPREAGAITGAATAASPRGADRCAALDPAGRCRIYPARPLVCRSHGVPIRMRRGGLPVIQACHRNFTHTEPDPDCVLDQATLSASLWAVNAAAGGAASPAERVDLARLLAGLVADLAAI